VGETLKKINIEAITTNLKKKLKMISAKPENTNASRGKLTLEAMGNEVLK
jgi:hypothetical protein